MPRLSKFDILILIYIIIYFNGMVLGGENILFSFCWLVSHYYDYDFFLFGKKIYESTWYMLLRASFHTTDNVDQCRKWPKVPKFSHFLTFYFTLMLKPFIKFVESGAAEKKPFLVLNKSKYSMLELILIIHIKRKAKCVWKCY